MVDSLLVATKGEQDVLRRQSKIVNSAERMVEQQSSVTQRMVEQQSSVTSVTQTVVEGGTRGLHQLKLTVCSQLPV